MTSSGYLSTFDENENSIRLDKGNISLLDTFLARKNRDKGSIIQYEDEFGKSYGEVAGDELIISQKIDMRPDSKKKKSKNIVDSYITTDKSTRNKKKDGNMEVRPMIRIHHEDTEQTFRKNGRSALKQSLDTGKSDGKMSFNNKGGKKIKRRRVPGKNDGGHEFDELSRGYLPDNGSAQVFDNFVSVPSLSNQDIPYAVSNVYSVEKNDDQNTGDRTSLTHQSSSRKDGSSRLSLTRPEVKSKIRSGDTPSTVSKTLKSKRPGKKDSTVSDRKSRETANEGDVLGHTANFELRSDVDASLSASRNEENVSTHKDTFRVGSSALKKGHSDKNYASRLHNKRNINLGRRGESEISSSELKSRSNLETINKKHKLPGKKTDLSISRSHLNDQLQYHYADDEHHASTQNNDEVGKDSSLGRSSLDPSFKLDESNVYEEESLRTKQHEKTSSRPTGDSKRLVSSSTINRRGLPTNTSNLATSQRVKREERVLDGTTLHSHQSKGSDQSEIPQEHDAKEVEGIKGSSGVNIESHAFLSHVSGRSIHDDGRAIESQEHSGMEDSRMKNIVISFNQDHIAMSSIGGFEPHAVANSSTPSGIIGDQSVGYSNINYSDTNNDMKPVFSENVDSLGDGHGNITTLNAQNAPIVSSSSTDNDNIRSNIAMTNQYSVAGLEMVDSNLQRTKNERLADSDILVTNSNYNKDHSQHPNTLRAPDIAYKTDENGNISHISTGKIGMYSAIDSNGNVTEDSNVVRKLEPSLSDDERSLNSSHQKGSSELASENVISVLHPPSSSSGSVASDKSHLGDPSRIDSISKSMTGPVLSGEADRVLLHHTVGDTTMTRIDDIKPSERTQSEQILLNSHAAAIATDMNSQESVDMRTSEKHQDSHAQDRDFVTDNNNLYSESARQLSALSIGNNDKSHVSEPIPKGATYPGTALEPKSGGGVIHKAETKYNSCPIDNSLSLRDSLPERSDISSSSKNAGLRKVDHPSLSNGSVRTNDSGPHTGSYNASKRGFTLVSSFNDRLSGYRGTIGDQTIVSAPTAGSSTHIPDDSKSIVKSNASDNKSSVLSQDFTSTSSSPDFNTFKSAAHSKLDQSTVNADTIGATRQSDPSYYGDITDVYTQGPKPRSQHSLDQTQQMEVPVLPPISTDADASLSEGKPRKKELTTSPYGTIDDKSLLMQQQIRESSILEEESVNSKVTPICTNCEDTSEDNSVRSNPSNNFDASSGNVPMQAMLPNKSFEKVAMEPSSGSAGSRNEVMTQDKHLDPLADNRQRKAFDSQVSSSNIDGLVMAADDKKSRGLLRLESNVPFTDNTVYFSSSRPHQSAYHSSSDESKTLMYMADHTSQSGVSLADISSLAERRQMMLSMLTSESGGPLSSDQYVGDLFGSSVINSSYNGIQGKAPHSNTAPYYVGADHRSNSLSIHGSRNYGNYQNESNICDANMKGVGSALPSFGHLHKPKVVSQSSLSTNKGMKYSSTGANGSLLEPRDHHKLDNSLFDKNNSSVRALPKIPDMPIPSPPDHNLNMIENLYGIGESFDLYSRNYINERFLAEGEIDETTETLESAFARRLRVAEASCNISSLDTLMPARALSDRTSLFEASKENNKDLVSLFMADNLVETEDEISALNSDFEQGYSSETIDLESESFIPARYRYDGGPQMEAGNLNISIKSKHRDLNELFFNADQQSIVRSNIALNSKLKGAFIMNHATSDKRQSKLFGENENLQKSYANSRFPYFVDDYDSSDFMSSLDTKVLSDAEDLRDRPFAQKDFSSESSHDYSIDSIKTLDVEEGKKAEDTTVVTLESACEFLTTQEYSVCQDTMNSKNISVSLSMLDQNADSIMSQFSTEYISEPDTDSLESMERKRRVYKQDKTESEITLVSQNECCSDVDDSTILRTLNSNKETLTASEFIPTDITSLTDPVSSDVPTLSDSSALSSVNRKRKVYSEAVDEVTLYSQDENYSEYVDSKSMMKTLTTQHQTPVTISSGISDSKLVNTSEETEVARHIGDGIVFLGSYAKSRFLHYPIYRYRRRAKSMTDLVNPVDSEITHERLYGSRRAKSAPSLYIHTLASRSKAKRKIDKYRMLRLISSSNASDDLSVPSDQNYSEDFTITTLHFGNTSAQLDISQKSIDSETMHIFQRSSSVGENTLSTKTDAFIDSSVTQSDSPFELKTLSNIYIGGVDTSTIDVGTEKETSQYTESTKILSSLHTETDFEDDMTEKAQTVSINTQNSDNNPSISTIVSSFESDKYIISEFNDPLNSLDTMIIFVDRDHSDFYSSSVDGKFGSPDQDLSDEKYIFAYRVSKKRAKHFNIYSSIETISSVRNRLFVDPSSELSINSKMLKYDSVTEDSIITICSSSERGIIRGNIESDSTDTLPPVPRNDIIRFRVRNNLTPKDILSGDYLISMDSTRKKGFLRLGSKLSDVTGEDAPNNTESTTFDIVSNFYNFEASFSDFSKEHIGGKMVYVKKARDEAYRTSLFEYSEVQNSLTSKMFSKHSVDLSELHSRRNIMGHDLTLDGMTTDDRSIKHRKSINYDGIIDEIHSVIEIQSEYYRVRSGYIGKSSVDKTKDGSVDQEGKVRRKTPLYSSDVFYSPGDGTLSIKEEYGQKYEHNESSTEDSLRSRHVAADEYTESISELESKANIVGYGRIPKDIISEDQTTEKDERRNGDVCNYNNIMDEVDSHLELHSLGFDVSSLRARNDYSVKFNVGDTLFRRGKVTGRRKRRRNTFDESSLRLFTKYSKFGAIESADVPPMIGSGEFIGTSLYHQKELQSRYDSDIEPFRPANYQEYDRYYTRFYREYISKRRSRGYTGRFNTSSLPFDLYSRRFSDVRAASRQYSSDALLYIIDGMFSTIDIDESEYENLDIVSADQKTVIFDTEHSGSIMSKQQRVDDHEYSDLSENSLKSMIQPMKARKFADYSESTADIKDHNEVSSTTHMTIKKSPEYEAQSSLLSVPVSGTVSMYGEQNKLTPRSVVSLTEKVQMSEKTRSESFIRDRSESSDMIKCDKEQYELESIHFNPVSEQDDENLTLNSLRAENEGVSEDMSLHSQQIYHVRGDDNFDRSSVFDKTETKKNLKYPTESLDTIKIDSESTIQLLSSDKIIRSSKVSPQDYILHREKFFSSTESDFDAFRELESKELHDVAQYSSSFEINSKLHLANEESSCDGSSLRSKVSPVIKMRHVEDSELQQERMIESSKQESPFEVDQDRDYKHIYDRTESERVVFPQELSTIDSTISLNSKKLEPKKFTSSLDEKIEESILDHEEDASERSESITIRSKDKSIEDGTELPDSLVSTRFRAREVRRKESLFDSAIIPHDSDFFARSNNGLRFNIYSSLPVSVEPCSSRYPVKMIQGTTRSKLSTNTIVTPSPDGRSSLNIAQYPDQLYSIGLGSSSGFDFEQPPELGNNAKVTTDDSFAASERDSTLSIDSQNVPSKPVIGPVLKRLVVDLRESTSNDQSLRVSFASYRTKFVAVDSQSGDTEGDRSAQTVEFYNECLSLLDTNPITNSLYCWNIEVFDSDPDDDSSLRSQITPIKRKRMDLTDDEPALVHDGHAGSEEYMVMKPRTGSLGRVYVPKSVSELGDSVNDISLNSKALSGLKAPEQGHEESIFLYTEDGLSSSSRNYILSDLRSVYPSNEPRIELQYSLDPNNSLVSSSVVTGSLGSELHIKKRRGTTSLINVWNPNDSTVSMKQVSEDIDSLHSRNFRSLNDPVLRRKSDSDAKIKLPTIGMGIGDEQSSVSDSSDIYKYRGIIDGTSSSSLKSKFKESAEKKESITSSPLPTNTTPSYSDEYTSSRQKSLISKCSQHVTEHQSIQESLMSEKFPSEYHSSDFSLHTVYNYTAEIHRQPTEESQETGHCPRYFQDRSVSDASLVHGPGPVKLHIDLAGTEDNISDVEMASLCTRCDKPVSPSSSDRKVHPTFDKEPYGDLSSTAETIHPSVYVDSKDSAGKYPFDSESRLDDIRTIDPYPNVVEEFSDSSLRTIESGVISSTTEQSSIKSKLLEPRKRVHDESSMSTKQDSADTLLESKNRMKEYRYTVEQIESVISLETVNISSTEAEDQNIISANVINKEESTHLEPQYSEILESSTSRSISLVSEPKSSDHDISINSTMDSKSLTSLNLRRADVRSKGVTYLKGEDIHPSLLYEPVSDSYILPTHIERLNQFIEEEYGDGLILPRLGSRSVCSEQTIRYTGEGGAFTHDYYIRRQIYGSPHFPHAYDDFYSESSEPSQVGVYHRGVDPHNIPARSHDRHIDLINHPSRNRQDAFEASPTGYQVSENGASEDQCSVSKGGIATTNMFVPYGLSVSKFLTPSQRQRVLGIEGKRGEEFLAVVPDRKIKLIYEGREELDQDHVSDSTISDESLRTVDAIARRSITGIAKGVEPSADVESAEPSSPSIKLHHGYNQTLSGIQSDISLRTKKSEVRSDDSRSTSTISHPDYTSTEETESKVSELNSLKYDDDVNSSLSVSGPVSLRSNLLSNKGDDYSDDISIRSMIHGKKISKSGIDHPGTSTSDETGPEYPGTSIINRGPSLHYKGNNVELSKGISSTSIILDSNKCTNDSSSSSVRVYSDGIGDTTESTITLVSKYERGSPTVYDATNQSLGSLLPTSHETSSESSSLLTQENFNRRGYTKTDRAATEDSSPCTVSDPNIEPVTEQIKTSSVSLHTLWNNLNVESAHSMNASDKYKLADSTVDDSEASEEHVSDGSLYTFNSDAMDIKSFEYLPLESSSSSGSLRSKYTPLDPSTTQSYIVPSHDMLHSPMYLDYLHEMMMEDQSAQVNRYYTANCEQNVELHIKTLPPDTDALADDIRLGDSISVSADIYLKSIHTGNTHTRIDLSSDKQQVKEEETETHPVTVYDRHQPLDSTSTIYLESANIEHVDVPKPLISNLVHGIDIPYELDQITTFKLPHYIDHISHSPACLTQVMIFSESQDAIISIDTPKRSSDVSFDPLAPKQSEHYETEKCEFQLELCENICISSYQSQTQTTFSRSSIIEHIGPEEGSDKCLEEFTRITSSIDSDIIIYSRTIDLNDFSQTMVSAETKASHMKNKTHDMGSKFVPGSRLVPPTSNRADLRSHKFKRGLFYQVSESSTDNDSMRSRLEVGKKHIGERMHLFASGSPSAQDEKSGRVHEKFTIPIDENQDSLRSILPHEALDLIDEDDDQSTLANYSKSYNSVTKSITMHSLEQKAVAPDISSTDISLNSEYIKDQTEYTARSASSLCTCDAQNVKCKDNESDVTHTEYSEPPSKSEVPQSYDDRGPKLFDHSTDSLKTNFVQANSPSSDKEYSPAGLEYSETLRTRESETCKTIDIESIRISEKCDYTSSLSIDTKPVERVERSCAEAISSKFDIQSLTESSVSSSSVKTFEDEVITSDGKTVSSGKSIHTVRDLDDESQFTKSSDHSIRTATDQLYREADPPSEVTDIRSKLSQTDDTKPYDHVCESVTTPKSHKLKNQHRSGYGGSRLGSAPKTGDSSAGFVTDASNMTCGGPLLSDANATVDSSLKSRRGNGIVIETDDTLTVKSDTVLASDSELTQNPKSKDTQMKSKAWYEFTDHSTYYSDIGPSSVISDPPNPNAYDDDSITLQSKVTNVKEKEKIYDKSIYSHSSTEESLPNEKTLSCRRTFENVMNDIDSNSSKIATFDTIPNSNTGNGITSLTSGSRVKKKRRKVNGPSSHAISFAEQSSSSKESDSQSRIDTPASQSSNKDSYRESSIRLPYSTVGKSLRTDTPSTQLDQSAIPSTKSIATSSGDHSSVDGYSIPSSKSMKSKSHKYLYQSESSDPTLSSGSDVPIDSSSKLLVVESNRAIRAEEDHHQHGAQASVRDTRRANIPADHRESSKRSRGMQRPLRQSDRPQLNPIVQRDTVGRLISSELEALNSKAQPRKGHKRPTRPLQPEDEKSSDSWDSSKRRSLKSQKKDATRYIDTPDLHDDTPAVSDDYHASRSSSSYEISPQEIMKDQSATESIAVSSRRSKQTKDRTQTSTIGSLYTKSDSNKPNDSEYSQGKAEKSSDTSIAEIAGPDASLSELSSTSMHSMSPDERQPGSTSEVSATIKSASDVTYSKNSGK